MTKEAHILEARCRIGARLLFLRNQKGLKQKFVAEQIGVTNWTIGKVEAGKYNFGIDILSAYCAIMGRTLEDMWSDDTELP